MQLSDARTLRLLTPTPRNRSIGHRQHLWSFPSLGKQLSSKDFRSQLEAAPQRLLTQRSRRAGGICRAASVLLLQLQQKNKKKVKMRSSTYDRLQHRSYM